jgi:hypothetical protein
MIKKISGYEKDDNYIIIERYIKEIKCYNMIKS